ncbi:MAG: F0F1 ATP synthase subunit A [Candidatus Omnitrophota bacterium]
MIQENTGQIEIINIVSFLANRFKGTVFASFLYHWENIIFSLIVALILILLSLIATRKMALTPRSRMQNIFEVVIGGIDDFICSILGPRGRKFTPFIGTIFIYILFMNLFGLIPFMKSATSNLSVTLSLALCVFVYVQYTAFKEAGFVGYFKHMAGDPKGFLGASIIFPVLMFILHTVSELIKPITLSLRLRSNIWGDDMLLSVLASFGIKGIPLIVFTSLIIIFGAVVQAIVFSLLSTIYFAFVLKHEEKEE